MKSWYSSIIVAIEFPLLPCRFMLNDVIERCGQTLWLSVAIKRWGWTVAERPKDRLSKEGLRKSLINRIDRLRLVGKPSWSVCVREHRQIRRDSACKQTWKSGNAREQQNAAGNADVHTCMFHTCIAVRRSSCIQNFLEISNLKNLHNSIVILSYSDAAVCHVRLRDSEILIGGSKWIGTSNRQLSVNTMSHQ